MIKCSTVIFNYTVNAIELWFEHNARQARYDIDNVIINPIQPFENRFLIFPLSMRCERQVANGGGHFLSR